MACVGACVSTGVPPPPPHVCVQGWYMMKYLYKRVPASLMYT